MGDKKYKLRFLPLFVDDLTEITDYIFNTLNNPHAANKLIDEVENAINERLPFAESFEPFPSKNERKYPYYRISVRNFTIYYVVIDDVMEVRRILYSKRNISKLI